MERADTDRGSVITISIDGRREGRAPVGLSRDRRVPQRLLTVVLFATLALAACAGRAPLPERPSCPPGAGVTCDSKPLTNPVLGTLRESGDCVWLELDRRVEARIVWPSGYTATHHPLVVFDAAGHEAIREGNRLSVLGPFGGEPDACGRAQWVELPAR